MSLNTIDTFNRANESPVSDGSKWTIGGVNNSASGPKVVSNQLQRALASPTFARDNAYRNDISFAANVNCQVGITIVTMSNDGELDLSLFNTSTRNGYQLICQSSSFGTPQLVLSRSDAGTGVNIDTNASFIPASSDGYVLQVIDNDVIGYAIRSNAWTEVLRATDTTYRVTFNPGVEVVGNVDTTTMVLDNFGANIVPAPNTMILPVDVPFVYLRKNQ